MTNRRARLGRGWEHRVAMLKCDPASTLQGFHHVKMTKGETRSWRQPLFGPALSKPPACAFSRVGTARGPGMSRSLHNLVDCFEMLVGQGPSPWCREL